MHLASANRIQAGRARKPGHLDVAESVISEAWLPVLPRSIPAQNVSVRRFGAAKIRDVNAAIRVGHFRIANPLSSSGRAANVERHPSAEVLAEIVYVDARRGL